MKHLFERCVVCSCLLAIGSECPHVGPVDHRLAIVPRDAIAEQLDSNQERTGFVGKELRRAVTDVTTSSGAFIDRMKDPPIRRVPTSPNFPAYETQPSDAPSIWFATQVAVARSTSS